MDIDSNYFQLNSNKHYSVELLRLMLCWLCLQVASIYWNVYWCNILSQTLLWVLNLLS
jgi:hypothetical protein